MSNTLLQTDQAFPNATYCARIALHAFVLMSVTLFPCATPNIKLLELTESEVPVGEEESSEEAAIRVQTHTRASRNQPGLPLLAPAHGGLSRQKAGTGFAQQSGHRLPNNLMAPLRC